MYERLVLRTLDAALAVAGAIASLVARYAERHGMLDTPVDPVVDDALDRMWQADMRHLTSAKLAEPEWWTDEHDAALARLHRIEAHVADGDAA